MTPKAEMARRAELGAAFLDAVKPKWWLKIKTPDLDMRSASHCILGQSYRGFWDALKKLQMSVRESEMLGFNISAEDYPNPAARSKLWSVLAESWHYQIELRKSAAGFIKPKAPKQA